MNLKAVPMPEPDFWGKSWNYLKSLNEYREGKLRFSSDVNELKKDVELD